VVNEACIRSENTNDAEQHLDTNTIYPGEEEEKWKTSTGSVVKHQLAVLQINVVTNNNEDDITTFLP
jgi:hypothetical protein